MRVHHKKERWSESSLWKKNARVRVDHAKKSDGVRVQHEKRSHGVRVYHEKEQWGESSP